MDIIKSLKRSHRKQSGTTMLETAIVLPVLLLILFGIVESGILLSRFLIVTNAAREGVRTAIVFQKTCDAGTVTTAVQNTVINYTSTAGITTVPGDVAVAGICSGSGTAATVTVTYAHTYRVIDRLAPTLASPVNVVGNSTMRNE
jgi:Flp pilus assembly protein TadG